MRWGEAVSSVDIHENETAPVKLCHGCGAGLIERDIFCRRCGTRRRTRTSSANAGLIPDSVASPDLAAASLSPYATSKLRAADPYHRVSGPLVEALTAGVANKTSEARRGGLARCLLLMLVSLSIWLVIILLSPLDAYTAARAVSRRF